MMQKFIIQFNLMRTISHYSRIMTICIAKWSQDWQLYFNVTKCKVLHIGFKQLYKEYKLGSDCITSSNVERDLGFWLKFHEQYYCSAVVAKTN